MTIVSPYLSIIKYKWTKFSNQNTEKSYIDFFFFLKTKLHAALKPFTSAVRTYRSKVKGWKKIFHANEDQNKAGLAELTLHKVDFKPKTLTRDKEGH